ncbi:hypothetical protein [Budvicia diplopodorum]|uniref:hypothetical protein n=1 Tax=Budvicia diplopodorum TaxID=1119056 RepID=UPI00135C856C|nr:hypothetical protein [Budvicia diplopodorum]
MHNYIINGRILFDTFTGELSRLDNPKRLTTLSNNAARLLMYLIDSGYQIVPLEQLSAQIKNNNIPTNTDLVAAEIKHIAESFGRINELEQILVTYPHSVQLSTDVELTVVTSNRTFDDNSEKKPHIAQERLLHPILTKHGDDQPSSRPKVSSFVWYYVRIALIITLFMFLLYFSSHLFSSKPSYFSDYHFQDKYNACNVYIHNQKPTVLPHLKMRLEQFQIPCDTPKNIYFSLSADDKRESIQVCNSDPEDGNQPCTNFYVVKVK